MKKIFLILILCLFTGIIWGQETNVRLEVDGSNVTLKRGADSLIVNIPYAGRIDLYTAMDTVNTVETNYRSDLIRADLADYDIGIAASDTATMLSKYSHKASPTFTGVPVAPTAAVGTNTTQLATTAFVLANDNTTLLAYQAMGSVIKALPIGTTISMVGSDLTMTDGRVYFIAVYLSTPQTITGVKFQSHTAGNYTADNYNGVGLYSVSGGTLTLVASSTDNANIWKGTTSTNITQAFSATYAAAAGLYYIAAVWNTSDGSPAAVPHIKLAAAFGAGAVQTFDFTNSLGLVAYYASATLPTPNIAASSLTTYVGGIPFIVL